jgi:hypothetical protein
MTEVGAHGLDEFILVVHDALEQMAQGFETLFELERSASVERALLTTEDLWEAKHSGNGSAGVVGCAKGGSQEPPLGVALIQCGAFSF